eukprot:m.27998 g.27998  ORF g.27998 m.27998 type:complete len:78 (-) comp6000_c0_seq1:1166-1399(-)
MSEGTPSEFLKRLLRKPVIVKLRSGVCYHGRMSCLDGFMNVALEDTREVVDGEVKAQYGDAFVRGNNVLFISPAPSA